MSSVFVFFDAGHTLLTPVRPVGEVYAEIAGHYGVFPDAERLEAGFRRAWKDGKKTGPVTEPRPGSRCWWHDLVFDAWKEVGVPETFPFEDYFEEVFQCFSNPRLWRVYGDAWDALELLQDAGVGLGILSNWDHRLHAILKGHELQCYFASVVISEEVGHAKPETALFRAAGERAGDVDRLILIGDDPELDGKGAQQAGWEFRMVKRPEKDLKDLAQGIIESL